MSADNSLIEDHAAQAILDQLLKSWQPPGRSDSPGAPGVAAPPVGPPPPAAHALPDVHYPPRLPSLRPTWPAAGTRRRPQDPRAVELPRDDAVRAGDPAAATLGRRPSFEAIADEISARATPIRPEDDEDDEEDESAIGQIRPDELGPEERRFAARIVALDAAGTLDHSAATPAQPPIGRIGGYRFFSEEENPEDEEDERVVPDETEHLLALAAVFNADPMAFEAEDAPAGASERTMTGGPARRPSEVPSLSEDDIAEELAIKSIFL